MQDLGTNETGVPVDYEFVEINDAFERITSLKREDIIGAKVSAVLPGIGNDPTDWIGKYGQVALTGEEQIFESYSASLEKWFHAGAYSPENGYFAVIIEDITERKQAGDLVKKRTLRGFLSNIKTVLNPYLYV